MVNARHQARNNPSDSFIDADWDILILLDACRADYYREQTPFEGTPQTRWAPGSASHEFFEAEFLGRQLHDTVYVTPNPHLYVLDGETFHTVHDCRDAWDSRLQTVRPETLTEIAKEVAADYPNKRLVVHYMQPHAPYLGETADRIRSAHGMGGWKPDHVSDGTPEKRERPLIWDLAAAGTIEWSVVRQAYTETLDLALTAVENLLASVEGRVVVSADHGELLGERLVPGGPREWSHPGGLDAVALREVPWHIIQKGPRRDIVAEPPENPAGLNEESVESRLAALGYTPDADR